MNSEEVKFRIETDADFINIKRFDFSLKKLLERYPEGVPTRIMCTALQMDELALNKLEKTVLEKLKLKLE